MKVKTNPAIVLVVVSMLWLPAISLRKRKAILEPNTDCGIPYKGGLPRVIGGINAGKWPWQAAILRPSGSKFAYSSSGVLINSQWVLTCAHCVINVREEYDKIKVVLGEYNLAKNDTLEQFHGVSDIRIHYNYSVGPDTVHDIALIKLSRKAKYTNVIKPICLPPANEREAVGTKCSLTGWGATQYPNVKLVRPDILQEVDLPVVDFAQCNRTILEVGPNFYYDNTTQFCAGYGKLSNKTGCYGDSGGPFSCNENGTFVLRGIAATAQDRYCRTKPTNAFTTFERVSVYIDWIKKQMTTPPEKYPECKDTHWACCKFAKSKECTTPKLSGLSYHLRYKYCPITCYNPKCFI